MRWAVDQGSRVGILKVKHDFWALIYYDIKKYLEQKPFKMYKVPQWAINFHDLPYNLGGVVVELFAEGRRAFC